MLLEIKIDSLAASFSGDKISLRSQQVLTNSGHVKSSRMHLLHYLNPI